MSPTLLTLLTFLAVVLVVVGIYSLVSDLFLRDRSRITRRVDEELLKKQREKAQKSKLFKDLATLSAETLEDEEANPSVRRRFETMVEQSGLELTPEKLLTIMGLGALALGLIGFLLPGRWIAIPVGVAIGALAPMAYVAWKRKARMEKLMSQLPDAFDLMARVIRAGQTMTQGMQAVADEFELPISAEFAYCYEQQNLGLSPDIALRDLAKRTGVLEIKIFVLAMLVQQQTGGNLAEMLDKLSTVMRERFRIRGRIRALTAEGRLQAAVLLILPVVLLLAILVLNRNYGQVLLDHSWLLAGMGIFEVLGALWIRKIVNFDF